MWAGQLRTRYHHNRGWSAVRIQVYVGHILNNFFELVAYVCSYIVFDKVPQIV